MLELRKIPVDVLDSPIVLMYLLFSNSDQKVLKVLRVPVLLSIR
jgi:hypothetical protein